MSITIEAIDASSDDALFKLLGTELQNRVSAKRGSPEFVSEIRRLPSGLRAMATTYELDVSLALDDLGWHFGNWHNKHLAEETARGLELLGATELSVLFRQAFQIARDHWTELGSKNWTELYHGSPFEKAVEPLTKQAWSILRTKRTGFLNTG